MMKRGLFYRSLRGLAHFLSSLVLVLVLFLLMTPDHISPADSFDIRLSIAVNGERFDLLSWLVGAFVGKVEDKLSNDISKLNESQRSALIEKYFQLAREEEDLRGKLLQARASSASAAQLQTLSAQLAHRRADKLAFEDRVERIIAERVEYAAQAEGLAQNLPLNAQIVLPPVAFKYVAPPLLLVMSPHEQIEKKWTLTLLPALALDQIEAVESKADQLGVVSLVVPIGGMGTYPTMVLENSSYDVSLEIVSHEWTHNYLDVRPLGWHYGDNGQMTSINETTAELVGHELSNRVRALPPPSYEDTPEPPPRVESNKPAEFDFNREMGATLLDVQAMLKEGKVQEAEAYMEARRKVFVARGYAIRKLNQAYFAFYNSYATGGVGGAVNPIGGELKRLRVASGSLKAYLDNISQVSSFEEYRALLKAKGVPEGKRP